MIFNMVTIGGGNVASSFPKYTYTGESVMMDDGLDAQGRQMWRLKFLTSGQLTVEHDVSVDAFLVGAGGSGGRGTSDRGGGGGGYTLTERAVALLAGVAYDIVIGQGTTGDGEPTTAFGFIAAGGKTETHNGGNGGSGGGNSGDPGGDGGRDGGNGGTTIPSRPAGLGQGTTTREFGEPNGPLYAGGGGGCCWSTDGIDRIGRGMDGGGDGTWKDGPAAGDGKPNTGGGGGGADGKSASGKGGSGVVVIRNQRVADAIAMLNTRVSHLEENAVNNI